MGDPMFWVGFHDKPHCSTCAGFDNCVTTGKDMSRHLPIFRSIRGITGRTLRFLAILLMTGLASPALAETKWSVGPSMKFDVVCLTGILANDSYQTQFYGSQREDLVRFLPPQAVEAGARVHEAFKTAGVPTAGFLALIFSTTEASDLDGLIVDLRRTQAARARLEASPYWNAERWAIYERVQPDLLTYLTGLRDAGFARWWASGPEIEVETLLTTLRPRLDAIQFSELIERKLGRPGPSTIMVHATRFCRPFGARLLGDTFLIDVVGKKDPFRSVGAGAIHEMTHPPFDQADPRIIRAIAMLERDPTLAKRFAERPRDSGYNSFEGYIDEDMTRALDQLIGERVGVTFMDDADARFRTQEGGFHMAAAVFFHLMKDEAFLDSDEDATGFLDRMVNKGRLAPERIRAIVDRVEAGGRDKTP